MTQPTYKPSVAEYRSDHALTVTRTQSDPDNQEILTISSVPPTIEFCEQQMSRFYVILLINKQTSANEIVTPWQR